MMNKQELQFAEKLRQVIAGKLSHISLVREERTSGLRRSDLVKQARELGLTVEIHGNKGYCIVSPENSGRSIHRC